MLTSAVIPVTTITSGLGVLLNSVILFFVLTQGRRRYHYLFAGILAICALWDLCIFLMMIRNDHVDEVQAFGYVIIPCCMLPTLMYHFATTYINQPRKWATIFLWGFAILAMVGMLTGLSGRIDGVFRYPWGNIFRPDRNLAITNLVALPVWYVITLATCWLLFRAYRQEKEPVARRHLLYVLASMFAISMAVIKVVVVLGVEQGFFLTFGMLANDVSAAVIGIAIIKDRLFDITPIIKKGLIYSFLATMVIFVFSFSEHMLTTYVAEQIGGHSEVLHVVAVAVSIAVLMPVKRQVEHRVDGYFGDRKLRF